MQLEIQSLTRTDAELLHIQFHLFCNDYARIFPAIDLKFVGTIEVFNEPCLVPACLKTRQFGLLCGYKDLVFPDECDLITRAKHRVIFTVAGNVFITIHGRQFRSESLLLSECVGETGGSKEEFVHNIINTIDS